MEGKVPLATTRLPWIQFAQESQINYLIHFFFFPLVFWVRFFLFSSSLKWLLGVELYPTAQKICSSSNPPNLVMWAVLKIKWKSLSHVRLFAVHGILQARILEWVALPFSRGSSQPRDRTQVSGTAGGLFTSWAPREALFGNKVVANPRTSP